MLCKSNRLLLQKNVKASFLEYVLYSRMDKVPQTWLHFLFFLRLVILPLWVTCQVKPQTKRWMMSKCKGSNAYPAMVLWIWNAQYASCVDIFRNKIIYLILCLFAIIVCPHSYMLASFATSKTRIFLSWIVLQNNKHHVNHTMQANNIQLQIHLFQLLPWLCYFSTYLKVDRL